MHLVVRLAFKFFLRLLIAQACWNSKSWNIRCLLRNQPAHQSVWSVAVAESYSEGEFTSHGIERGYNLGSYLSGISGGTANSSRPTASDEICNFR